MSSEPTPEPVQWKVGPHVTIDRTSGATHRNGRSLCYRVSVRVKVQDAPKGSNAGPTFARRSIETETFDGAGIIATEWAAWADQAIDALRNIGIIR